jgi:hypothetical protein
MTVCGVEIEVVVLDDGQRVIPVESMQKFFDMFAEGEG